MVWGGLLIGFNGRRLGVGGGEIAGRNKRRWDRIWRAREMNGMDNWGWDRVRAVISLRKV